MPLGWDIILPLLMDMPLLIIILYIILFVKGCDDSLQRVTRNNKHRRAKTPAAESKQ